MEDLIALVDAVVRFFKGLLDDRDFLHLKRKKK